MTLALDGIVSHSIAPLRLASFVGFSLSLAAVIAIGIYLVRYQTNWPAGFATLAILMLVSLAMNALFLGIIGEYIGRMYRQVKPGPLTIVDRLIDRMDARQPETEDRGTRSVSGIVLPKTEPEDGLQRKDQALEIESFDCSSLDLVVCGARIVSAKRFALPVGARGRKQG